MNKQTLAKIISGLIVFVFVVSIFQFAIPAQAAQDSSISSLYSNPNQSSKSSSTYKFKVSDVVNSSLLTSVIGCTGIVNKVAGWMAKFVQSPVKQAKILAQKLGLIKDQLTTACTSTTRSCSWPPSSPPPVPAV